MRTTESGCFTYPKYGRVNSSEAGHAVRMVRCGCLDNSSAACLCKQHIVAIQQRVLRCNAIGRRNK